MRITSVVAAAAAVAAVAAPLAAGSPSRSQCTPGMSTIHGFQARTFCGPAKMQAKAGSANVSISGGQCAISQGYWTINIGTVELGNPHPTHDYFGIAIMKKGARDGTYANQMWALRAGGKPYAGHGTVVIKGGGTSGTFSGATVITNIPVSGSFSCS